MICSPGVVEVPRLHFTAGMRYLGSEQLLASASTAASVTGPPVPLPRCSFVQLFLLAPVDVPRLALADGRALLDGRGLLDGLALTDGPAGADGVAVSVALALAAVLAAADVLVVTGGVALAAGPAASAKPLAA